MPFQARPVDVYRALRALNPSPYMYFLDVGGTQVVGSSPEILVRLQGGEITVRPIAGTRPRGATPEEDAALEAELLADPKERAEHLMLIDLGRNDVGRVAEPGTVEVGEQFVIERYSHVMHIVSEVTGTLKHGPELRRRAARDVPGRHRQRRAEDPRAGSDPRTRTDHAATSTPAPSATSAGTAMPTPPSPSAPPSSRTAACTCRPAPASSTTPIRQKEWEETMNKGRALFRAVAEAARGL